MRGEKLAALDFALDGQMVRPLLEMAAKEYWGTTVQVENVAVKIIRSRSSRCVICYNIDIYDSVTKLRKQVGIFGKVFRPRRGEKTFELMEQLWEHGFDAKSKDGIFIPDPMYFFSDKCLMLQEKIPGLPAKDLLKIDPSNYNNMRIVVRTIAKLHRTPIVPGRNYTVQDHLQRCHPRYPFLAMACPELEEKIEFIVQGALQLTQKYACIEPCATHGDFHLRQIHIEKENAWLIDFDAMCYADPAADIGNLLVFLKSKAQRHRRHWVYIEEFVDEYISIMGPDILKRVPIYEALTHLRRACKVLRFQKKNWRKIVTEMIDSGAACIESAFLEKDAIYSSDAHSSGKPELDNKILEYK